MSSILKTTNIKHESSSSNNLVLGSDGTTTTTLSSSANIKSAINASGDAPIYACRAWVNFDGTNAFSPNPSTSAIRASGNVSSITQNGSGDYTINFTTAMDDNDYACLLSGINRGTASATNYSVGYYTTSPHRDAVDYNSGSVRILNHMGNSATMIDTDTISVAIFR